MAEILKFLHASDLHLDHPYQGAPDVPSHIKSSLIDAAYDAAENIFDRAVDDQVDFVLLSGDIADVDRCGPRGISFLIDQFSKLGQNNIHVYWAGGEEDQLERWPAMLSALPNVTLFTTTLVEEVLHRRGGRVIASILGAGYDRRKRRIAEFRAEETKAFPIGLCYGNLETEEIAKTGIRYWALGGNHIRRTFTRDDAMLVFPGTSQSRGPHESGIHGATSVSVNENGFIDSHFIPTDSVRWIEKRIRMTEGMAREEIRTMLEDEAFGMISESHEKLLLVDWQVAAEGKMNGTLHCNDWLAELKSWLCNEFGTPDHRLWSTQLEVLTPQKLPDEWFEEDTMLGDYLRSVKAHQQDATQQIDLTKYLNSDISGEQAISAVQIDAQRKNEILKESAMMGVQLLSGTDEF